MQACRPLSPWCLPSLGALTLSRDDSLVYPTSLRARNNAPLRSILPRVSSLSTGKDIQTYQVRDKDLFFMTETLRVSMYASALSYAQMQSESNYGPSRTPQPMHTKGCGSAHRRALGGYERQKPEGRCLLVKEHCPLCSLENLFPTQVSYYAKKIFSGTFGGFVTYC